MKAPQDIDRTRMVILPEQEHGERLARVLKYMAKAGLESMLLCDNANKFYITGRIFDGYIYIGPDGQVSYFVRRPSILEGKSVHHIHKPENILEIINREGLGRPSKLGLELMQTSYATVMRLAAALGVDSFGNADSVMLSARAVKTAYEIQQIAVCGMRHDRVYSRIPHLYHEGMSDVELQIEIERVTRLEGGLGIIRTVGQSMEINMGSVLAGRNADEPSPYDFALGGAGTSPALPVGADGTVLRAGMSVMVDTNGVFNGYMTDMTRTFAVGNLLQRAIDLHKLSCDICHTIEDMARPGVRCSDLCRKALDMAAKAGASNLFMGHNSQASFVGHGLGIALNELPVISLKTDSILEVGNVLAIEPKFVIPDVGAVGIENTCAVTDDGPMRRLTNAPEELITLVS